jgi:gliding motility-associated-like protein
MQQTGVFYCLMMSMRCRLLIFSFLNLFLSGYLEAQLKYNNTWVFGSKAGINFNTNPASSYPGSNMSAYRSASSVSDPVTGQLLFYTNGNSFWNRFGEMIDSSQQGSSVMDVLILPLKQFRNRFIVFNLSSYFIIDMQARNGRGVILETRPFVPKNQANRMTAVRHCLSDSYWLISVDRLQFYAYLVHPDGRIDAPVISPNNSLAPVDFLGDFVSSNNGEKLAITYYSADNNDKDLFYPPRMFEFDKRCGFVSQGAVQLPMDKEWDMPHGVAFSPDDRLIYIAYGYQESQLAQYEVNNPSVYYVAATSPQNFNQIACGPDGRLYITTHINGVPSNKIDVLLNPNVKGAGCNYREDYMRLAGITNFEVPNLVMNHTGTCAGNKGFTLDVAPGVCTGQSLDFRLNGSETGIDSLRWFYTDPNLPGASFKGFRTSYIYKDAGIFKPYAVMYFCGHLDTFFFEVTVSRPERLFLGADTTLCPGTSIRVGNKSLPGTRRWNTGDTVAELLVQQATDLILQIDHKGCVSVDSISIRYYPLLQTLLGDAYYICEEENELVELDAGKGFVEYMWRPTLDTTQWIIVAKRGDYHVVVRDFRGCKGDDAAVVESRCDLQVFLPNAFTPNEDRLNDRLYVGAHNETAVILRIYSLWGELVYEGPNGWDGIYQGKIVPQGLYLLKVEAHGFMKKKVVVRNYTVTLHVIR